MELPTKLCVSRTVPGISVKDAVIYSQKMHSNMTILISIYMHRWSVIMWEIVDSMYETKQQYLHKITLKKPRAFPAYNRLVDPFFISFS